jgi:hypothetical protein
MSRRSRRTLLAALAAALIAGAPTARAANVDSFSYRGWRGWAYFDGDTFRHCAVAGTFADRSTLSFFYDDQGFKLAVQVPAWRIAPGSTHRVQVRVDPGLDGRVLAVAPTDNSLLMPLSGLNQPVRRLRRGYTLSLSAGELGRLSFDLTGTSVILKRLVDCYVAHD